MRKLAAACYLAIVAMGPSAPRAAAPHGERLHAAVAPLTVA